MLWNASFQNLKSYLHGFKRWQVIKSFDHWTQSVWVWWFWAYGDCWEFNIFNWKWSWIQNVNDWLINPYLNQNNSYSYQSNIRRGLFIYNSKWFPPSISLFINFRESFHPWHTFPPYNLIVPSLFTSRFCYPPHLLGR